MTAHCRLLTLLITCCTVVTYAQLPPPERVVHELSTIYRTSKPEIRTTTPTELRQRLVKTALGQAIYLNGTFKPSELVPESLVCTSGGSLEHEIRPNAHTATGFASLYYHDAPFPAEFTREDCLNRLTRILRFLVTTHGAGGVKCKDGKPWRNQWQSALWAYSTGEAAWFIWDKLPDDMRWLAARMICDEADRFIGVVPPSQITHDTKAEENAWNSAIIARAACMFQHHPHASQWEETAKRWAISSFARKADLKSTRVVDGKPVSEWLGGANIFDDYTLENHDRVHPDYHTTAKMLLGQRMLYVWAGKQPPEAFTFNTREVYRNIKIFSTPDGGYHYPNGQDWGLHRNPHWFNAHAQQSVLFGDREAARLAWNCLEASERMLARASNGGVFHPEEFKFPSTQHFALEEFTDALNLMATYGDGVDPATQQEVLRATSGAHLFEAGKLAVLRTEKSIASFAWGPQVMGLVGPLGKDLLVAPNERSMIGFVEAEGQKRERPRAVEIKVTTGTRHFAVTGRIERGGGAAEQRFGFVRLDGGKVVWADCLVQTSTTAVRRADLGSLSILNDPQWVYYDGDRALHHEGGREVFRSEGPDDDPPVSFDSPWYNVDDKLGIHVIVATGKQVYHPNHKMGNGRLEQLFHLNQRNFEAGAPTAEGAVLGRTFVLFAPGEGAAATKQRIGKLSATGADGKYSLTLASEVQVQINLNQLSVQVDFN